MTYTVSNAVTSRFLTAFSVSSGALVLLALWSFFEASFWFIAPDFLLMILCFFAPKKYLKFIFIAIFVSILGGISYYILNLFYFDQLTGVLLATPFVAQKNIDFVSNMFQTYGVVATFLQSFTLIPFKIWTHFAVQYNLSAFLYFLFVAISRFIRFCIFAFFALLMEKYFGRLIRKHLFISAALYCAIFFGTMFVLEA